MRWSVAPYVVLAVPKGFCGASGPFSSSILDTKRLLKGSPHVVPLARGTLGAKPKSTLRDSSLHGRRVKHCFMGLFMTALL